MRQQELRMSLLPHPTREALLGGPRSQVSRPPLGALLLERGLITRARLDAALDECARTGRRIGEVLADRGWVFENELARALAEQNGLTYVDIAATSVDPAAAELLPRDFAEHFVAVPVRVLSSGAVLVAVADPGAADIEVLRIAIGRDVEVVVGDLSAIRNAWRHCP
jgi:Type II secretion system (T2SS), protein E, N-terminal domain